MNGEELLTKFIEFIRAEKPQRFFQYHDRPERPFCWVSPYSTEYGWVGNQQFLGDCKPCKLIRKTPEVTADYTTEACYGAYDAVLFMRCEGYVFDVIPIEAKGNTDVLDDRLREQIWIAVKNYGKSLLLLDTEQAFKVKKNNLHKYLPCEIWAWNGVTFIQVAENIIRHSPSNGELKISKRAIEKATGIHDSSKLNKLQKRIIHWHGVINALAFNQWNFGNERKFTEEEAELFYKLLDEPLLPNVCKPKEVKVTAKNDLSNVRSTGFSEKLLQKTLLEVSGV